MTDQAKRVEEPEVVDAVVLARAAFLRDTPIAEALWILRRQFGMDRSAQCARLESIPK